MLWVWIYIYIVYYILILWIYWMSLLKLCYKIVAWHNEALIALSKFLERTGSLSQMLVSRAAFAIVLSLRVYFHFDVYRCWCKRRHLRTEFSFAVTTCDRSSKRCVTATRMTLFIVTWSRSAPFWLARKIPPRWNCAVSVLPCNSQPHNLMELVRSYFLLIHLRFLYAIYFYVA